MRGLLGPICFPADCNYPVGNFTVLTSHRPQIGMDDTAFCNSADFGWFFCVPTAAERIGLLMSFDTNGTVRQCDYGFSPHAAQT